MSPHSSPFIFLNLISQTYQTLYRQERVGLGMRLTQLGATA